jgi:hypothetical protein
MAHAKGENRAKGGGSLHDELSVFRLFPSAVPDDLTGSGIALFRVGTAMSLLTFAAAEL